MSVATVEALGAEAEGMVRSQPVSTSHEPSHMSLAAQYRALAIWRSRLETTSRSLETRSRAIRRLGNELLSLPSSGS